jgi:hypothetical protein
MEDLLMKNISIEKDSKFKECLKIAKKAKELRDEAAKVEQEAVQKFRSFYEEKRDALINQAQKLEADVKTSEKEIPKLISLFCEQKGHTFSYRKVVTEHREIGHTFGGSIYPTATYKTCIICGWTNDEGSCTEKMAESLSREKRIRDREYLMSKGMRGVARQIELTSEPKHYNTAYKPDKVLGEIKKALKSADKENENAEWKKTAQKIVDLMEEIKEKKAELSRIPDQRKNLCTLFGHEPKCISPYPPAEYKCKCCGKQSGSDYFYDDYCKAKYKGGITKSDCYVTDDDPII